MGECENDDPLAGKVVDWSGWDDGSLTIVFTDGTELSAYASGGGIPGDAFLTVAVYEGKSS